MIQVVDIRESRAGATVPSGVPTVVMGPFRLPRYITKTFGICNTGAVTLSGVMLQVNPDQAGLEPGIQQGNPTAPPVQVGPSTAMWVNYASSAFQNLAAGSTAVFEAPLTALFTWWQAVATNDRSQSITVSGYLSAAQA